MGIFDFKKKLLKRELAKAKKKQLAEAIRLKRVIAEEKELEKLRSQIRQQKKGVALTDEEKAILSRKKERIAKVKKGAIGTFKAIGKTITAIDNGLDAIGRAANKVNTDRALGIKKKKRARKKTNKKVKKRGKSKKRKS